MAYPSTLSTYTDPTPSDKLSTTPHSSIETAQNTGLKEIQAFVGTLSSNVGTLMYDIRGAGSNGGGHVQTANKGGTGQTAYTKGDILIASSSSVLTKLAVSANDNDFLAVNSSVATGVNWVAGVTGGQVQAQAFSNATDTGTGSVYSISPVPCVLGYSAGQVFTFQAANANTIAAPAISVSSLVAKTIKNPDGTALNVGQIAASAMTMIQYQGNASVFHLLSQKNSNALTTITNGTTTRGGDTASGSQTIAHGLGTTPKVVRFTALKLNASNNINFAMSFGSYNGTTTSTTWLESIEQGSSNNSSGVDTTNVIAIVDATGVSSKSQAATATFDATNITLTWTKTSTPSAATINIMWEAEA